MRILGIVGGIAPSSTIEYYRRIVDGVRQRTAEKEYPQVIVNSIDLRRMIPLFEAGDKEGAIKFLGGELDRLAAAGAQVALFASNTPHLYFRELSARSPIPLLSIVESVATEASQRGFRRVLLLGTRFTMRAAFYREALAAQGVDVVTPTEEDMTIVHDLYMRDLVVGRFGSENRAEVLGVIDRVRDATAIDAVVLGGTEIPLLLDAAEHAGLPLLDTTQIHVDRAIAEIMGSARSELERQHE